MPSGSTRKATHAGSWYSNKGTPHPTAASILSSQLSSFLSSAKCSTFHARAIIVPHAGYSYSGPCAGFGYKQVNPTEISRVFVLGPSHFLGFRGCALSPANKVETPMGTIEVDEEVVGTLRKSGIFREISLKDDMKEHSLEMQYPFIFQIFKNKDIKLVPIMVGSCDLNSLESTARLLSPYLSDRSNLFVISSDFCHWGEGFMFTPYDEGKGEIWESIKAMDEKGMEIIEKIDPAGFKNYLEETENTICGRYPILLLLHTIRECGVEGRLRFVRYEQSDQINSRMDSSVSYASAYFDF